MKVEQVSSALLLNRRTLRLVLRSAPHTPNSPLTVTPPSFRLPNHIPAQLRALSHLNLLVARAGGVASELMEKLPLPPPQLAVGHERHPQAARDELRGHDHARAGRVDRRALVEELKGRLGTADDEDGPLPELEGVDGSCLREKVTLVRAEILEMQRQLGAEI